jgi:hypothetical protein
VCGFAVLACVLSYPLVLNIGSHVPGEGAGDNIGFVWNVWWFRLVRAQGLAPFECSYLFAPFGTSLVLHTLTPLQSYVGATALSGLPIIVAHNVILLVGLAANGVAAYALAHYQVRQVMPAVLAGVLFAGSSYITLHLLGHFNLVNAWVLPTVALAWTALLARPSPLSGAFVALALGAATYSDYYYMVFAALFMIASTLVTAVSARVRWIAPRSRAVERVLVALMILTGGTIAAILVTGGFTIPLGERSASVAHVRNPVTALWVMFLVWLSLRCRIEIRRNTDRDFPGIRRLLVPLAVVAGVYVVIASPLLTAVVDLFSRGDYVTQFYRWHSAPRGIDTLTLVLGNPLHPLYGSLSRGLIDRFGIDVIEHVAWIGVVPIALGVWALRSRFTWDTVSLRWLTIGGVFLLWALGPYLTFAGHGTGVLLPQMFARWIPVVSNARIPSRAFVLVLLAIAVLCARFVAAGRWRPRTIVLLIALALFDGLAIPFPLYRMPAPGRIESFLAASPQSGSLLELPVGIQDSSGETGRFDLRSLVWQMTHEDPIVGGYVSRLSPRIRSAYQDSPTFSLLLALSTADAREPIPLPDDLSRALFAEGVRFVVVNTDRVPQLTRPEAERRGLRWLLSEGRRDLYAVPGE